MRLPRFTTRRLMVLVAVAGAALGLLVRLQALVQSEEDYAALIRVLLVVAAVSMTVGTLGFGFVLLLSLLIRIGDTFQNRLKTAVTPEQSKLPVPPDPPPPP